jgi:hypothetical protein
MSTRHYHGVWTIRERLLNDLCVDLGFCLPAEASQRLIGWPDPDPTAFADAVFEAEGLAGPERDLHLYREVRRRVAEALSLETP